MRTIKRNIRPLGLVTAFICSVAIISTLVVHLATPARATGIPKTDPLTYSGLLDDDKTGKPLSGNKTITVSLYAAKSGGTALCASLATTVDLTKTHGRFGVTLPSKCQNVIHQNPDLWVEVKVDSTTLPRIKVGAIPYAVEAAQVADPDCPPGYTKDTTAPASITVCKKGKDEMVKVGDFWIDRYEMSIADATTYQGGKCNGAGNRYGQGKDDYPTTFPDSGNWTNPIYGCSTKNTIPSDSMTWFQAIQACALAGKHLCTNTEWQTAAAGTPDDSASCNITTLKQENTGSRQKCVSLWGVQDMVGNAWEWVSWWSQAGKEWMKNDGEFTTPFPASYGYGDGKDISRNINGRCTYGGIYRNGMPGAAFRGGSSGSSVSAGVFSMDLSYGPTNWNKGIGARCCRR